MVETRWAELGGRELRYHDHMWTLTGTVDVKENGELLAVDATQVGDVRQPSAILYFGLENPPQSLNPGDLGEHFDHIERVNDTHHLVVKKEPRIYRYELLRLEYR